MAKQPLITAERLREVLDYDPDTGIFTWRVSKQGHIRAGAIGGTKKKTGYFQFKIEQRLYPAHRFAWLYMTGSWPKHQIDHINGQPGDNRFCNLREATQTQNNGNSRLRASNRSGRKGVSWHKLRGKWRATIKMHNKAKHLGLFDSMEEAARAYEDAAKEYFGEFAWF